MKRVGWLIGLIGMLAASACQPAPPAPAAAPTAASAPAASAPTASAPAAAPAASQATTLAAKPAPLSPPVTLRMGQLRSGSDLPIFFGLERGYFQEEGLDLQLEDFQTSAQMTPLIATGQLDIGLGGVNAGFFNSVAQGIPLKIVANQTLEGPEAKSCTWMARAELLNSGAVKEARDLKGLNFGLGSVGSVIDVELDRILNDGGLTRDDITIKQVAYPDQIAAFANASIDIAYVFEPTRTRLLEQGLTGVWRTCSQVYPNHESTVLVFGPSMDSKQEAGRRFLVAYLRGMRVNKEEMLDKRDPQGVELAVKWTAIKDPALWQKMELQRGNPDGYNTRASLEYDLNWFANNGFVEKPPRLDDMLDQSYVDYAIARLGRYKPGCGAAPCP